MGHERASARKHYHYDEFTIRDAYVHAFQFMSINGIQVRNDFAKFKGDVNTTLTQLSNIISEQTRTIETMKREWESMKAKMTPEEHKRFTEHTEMLREKEKELKSLFFFFII